MSSALGLARLRPARRTDDTTTSPTRLIDLHIQTPVMLVIGCLASNACAPRPKDNTSTRPDSTTTRPENAPAAAAAAQPDHAATSVAVSRAGPPPSPPVMRATPEPQGPAAAALVGTWDIGPPTGMRGPSLTIVIDSSRGPVFYGRLTRALSGDVELTEGTFRPFEGIIGPDSIARANIEMTEKGAPVTRIAGRLSSADVWTGTSLVWGGSELVKGDRVWKATKSR